jgi:hypothetical protein
MQKGEMKSVTMMMTAKNQSCRSQVHVTAFGVLRVKRQKMCLNRRPFASTAVKGGRLGSHPTPNHVIGKRTVNVTLAMGHQADPVHS